jgi:hypothetical protein
VLSEASAPILQCKASMAAFNAQSQLDPQLAAAVILVHCVADHITRSGLDAKIGDRKASFSIIRLCVCI